MSALAVVAIVLGVAVAVAAAAVAAVFGWRAYERRLLLNLLVRTEAVEAAADALSRSVERLAGGTDEDLELFADDPESGERRTLAEIVSRAQILTGELDRVALPERLVGPAEALADAAYVIAGQASLVTEEDRGLDALAHLGEMDLSAVRGYSEKARKLVASMCEQCGLDEMAVYGEGLYL